MSEQNKETVKPVLGALGFPPAAMVGSLADFAHLMGEGTEVPEEFYFACGLTFTGALAGTDLTLEIGTDVDPRLYTVLLGESYAVKKSTAMKRSIEFFSGLKTSKKPNICYGAASAEGLARVLRTHPNTVLAYDELQSLVDKCQIQGSALLPLVTTLFESNSWDNTTKSKSSSAQVRNARLSLIGCCTSDTYGNMWTTKALNIGLPNRLFVVNADRKAKVAWPKKPAQVDLDALKLRIEGQLAKLPKNFTIEPDALVAWEHWYAHVPQSSPHARRLETIGFRLLPIIALTTDKDSIDVDTVTAVIALLDRP